MVLTVVAGCSKVLGISDPTPAKGDGGTHDGKLIDGTMIDSGPPCIAAPSFGNETSYGLGAPGATLAVGDLDRDGKLDVAIGLGTKVVILHGDGMGHFGAPQDLDTAADGVLIDDFSLLGDGNDLVLWKIGGNLLVERRQDNTTNGQFLAEQPVSGFSNIATVMEGQFDGQFIPDLVVKDGTQRRVITSNAGTEGTFSSGPTIGTDGDVVAVANIDGAGEDDIAIVTSTGDLQVAYATGGGNFAAPVTIASGVVGRGVAFAKIDGDALLDLVLTSPNGGRVFLQSAGGTFTEQTGLVANAGGPALQVLDIDNNGLPDLVVAGGIIQQCAGGMFSPIVTKFSVAPPVVFADLDNNGKPDLLRLEGTQLKVRIQ